MTKGTQTREYILQRTAPLFNQRGYFGASLADIMQETGLEKGGIYNHFASKEQLALEAFDYAFELVKQRVRQALEGEKNAVDRLLAYISVFQEIAQDSPIAGGCPVLNTAIESDDAHEPLRARARAAMNELRTTISRILTKGIERGEICEGIDVEETTTVFIATLEGAVMLSKLYNDVLYIQQSARYLAELIRTNLSN